MNIAFTEEDLERVVTSALRHYDADSDLGVKIDQEQRLKFEGINEGEYKFAVVPVIPKAVPQEAKRA